ncbi:MAG TPA: helix-turn-helix domain-containing protein [Solirubrobacterales bacterium]|nr:helix-turn-helix domain-containing protein [Solirubrobacterales bacterium]
MDLPLEDDVLRQRTRARIFSWLVKNQAPVGTETISTALELHPNGVRRHLERMEEAGLIERTRSTGRRGRPGDLWAVAPSADPGGDRPTGYADLARWLARAIPPGRNRLREVKRAGQDIGRELAPHGSIDDPVDGFRRAIASLGFRPEFETRAEDGFVCKLENCPYRESVRENQDVVCALHEGITRGLLAEILPETKLTRFEPHDPERAGCVIAVSGSTPFAD